MFRLLTVPMFAIFLAVDLTAMADDPPAIDLLYEVDAKTNADAESLADLIARASQRVDPWGVVEKRRDSIRVRIFEAKHADAVERALSGGGSFELRILASASDHREIIAQAQESKAAVVKDPNGKTIARWIAIDKKVAADKSRYASWTTRIGDLQDLEALIVEDGHDVTGTVVESATASFDFRGSPCVAIKFTKEGAKHLLALTSDNLPNPVTGSDRQLAIIVRGYIVSAPTLRSAFGDAAEITGNFTQEETQATAMAITAGMKPLPLKLIRRELAKPRGPRRRSAPPPALSTLALPQLGSQSCSGC